jgi:D-3-phosphoglycerate dehydrogenase / 2-oxoglutarate reductase
MKIKVMISAPYMQMVIEQYRHVFEEKEIELIIPSVNERMSEQELLESINGVHGVICGDDKFTKNVIDAASKLKIIVKWGTGIDSIDAVACSRRKIIVRRTKNAFSEPVAETVLGYMLCFARQIISLDRNIKNGVWKKIMGTTLKESSLGVVGIGDAGKAVVRKANALGMRVMGFDVIDIDLNFIRQTGLELVSKETLLRESDFISLNTDLNPTSHHLINEREFNLMKSTAYLINTSRGSIINEDALANALYAKKIMGVALDVFEDEPLPTNSPLREFDNVILSPHNANSSPLAWERVHENSISMLFEGLRDIIPVA